MDHQATAERIAQLLLQVKAVKLNTTDTFTWASGIESPIYCDNRIILSYPKFRKKVWHALKEAAQSYKGLDGIAGVATAGIPHATAIAQMMDLPLVYVRSKPKGHGRQNLIEGEVAQSGHYLVIEDLISTGGSSLKAVAALRTAGADVAGVLAIFSYGFTRAEARFKEANCSVQTLTNFETLIQVAEADAYIRSSDIALMNDWHLQMS